MPPLPILSTREKGFERAFARVLARSIEEGERVERDVRAIMDAVRREGDRALVRFTRRFDRADVTAQTLEVDRRAMRDARRRAPREAIRTLRTRRRASSAATRALPKSWWMQGGPGVAIGEKITPLDRVGVYAPGGKAAYPSSVLMTAVPARAAGVREVVLATPATGGQLNPMVLASADVAGVDRVFRIGGAQAIAAMAYGTARVPRVDKIVGPGNIWVATAKRLVFGAVGIDAIAGPTEIVILADDTAHPDWVAADLLSQAEHDEAATAVIATSRTLIERVRERLLARGRSAAAGHRDGVARPGARPARSGGGRARTGSPGAPELAARPDLRSRIRHAGRSSGHRQRGARRFRGAQSRSPTAGTARFFRRWARRTL
jgi:histidinol dehydrogenase